MRLLFSFGSPIDKEIVLIRHATSEAQKTERRERRKSFALVDAKLHETGVEDMRQLGVKVQGNEELRDADIILCSPLSRAIQTACLVFESSKTRILLVPELSEFAITKGMVGYENNGRTYSRLVNDPNLRRLPKFKDIDFSLVKEYEANYGCDWWSKKYEPMKSDAQILRLKKLLLALPHQRIICVGHCCNFMKLLNTYKRIPNGTPIHCHLRIHGRNISVVRGPPRKSSKKKNISSTPTKVHAAELAS